MPKNLFGNLKPNQLMAMLQQQQGPYGAGVNMGQAPQQPRQEAPPQQQQSPPLWSLNPPPVPTPKDPYTGPVLPPTNFTASKGQQRMSKDALKDFDVTVTPTLGKVLGTAGAAEMEGSPLPDAGNNKFRPIGDSESEHELAPGYGEPQFTPRSGSLEEYLKNEIQLPEVPGASSVPSFGGPELFQYLSNEAQSRTKKKQEKDLQDFRNEFESTPELDKLIAGTQSQLEQAKSQRKQPGLGEFLTLALMNLGNRDHRNNADLVLGTGEQRDKERRLEDQLTQLQGGQASAKMGGRREFRSMQRQEKQSALERMMKQQEMQRKQGNEDREYALKKRGQDSGLLRALAGQEAQVVGGAVDEKTRKAAMESRNRLKKALGLDDAGLQKILDQQRMMQQQQAPQDERQSRMFGDMVAGGGYA